MKKKYSRAHIGEKYKTIEGCDVEIIDGGTKSGHCTIKIFGGAEVYIDEGAYYNVKVCGVKNKYFPSMFGVGYVGIGKYSPTKNRTINRAYDIWRKMLERAYSDDYHIKKPTYIKVEVCKEWHNYQNFAKWYYDNYREFSNHETHLDKDIIGDGTLYSPETCCFIPDSLNSFMSTNSGDNVTGYKNVTHYSKNKYMSRIHEFCTGKRIVLGRFDNPEDASDAYKQARKEQCEIVRQICIDKWGITDKRILNNIK